ncbi:MAG TPA: ribonuclease P protein component 4 [Methanomassiliicoccales archaeon]|jgi:ribonuclease P protein subunit RPR2|nr:ribonuclease P protein component 4 [Methanomassiliicoccales archaeon]
MSRRRITNREVKDLAAERIGKLLSLAESEALAGNMPRSKRYLGLALDISRRTNEPLPGGFLYCPNCLTPLVPGRNARVRTRSMRVVTTCLECDSKMRHPYVKERRGRLVIKDEKGA